MDISHLHLHVRDRTRSEAFYRRWFALRVANEFEAITFLKGDRDFLLALMEDAILTSFRCADPDAYTIEVYWQPV